jgi:2-polyprenyl-3-methyl-5-hydroxy-6-metoxy-1,4-benzoquinol methylase
MAEYGTQDWFEHIYRSSAGDPWGLNWRPTQLYRYGRMLSALSQVQGRSLRPEARVIDVGCATGDFTALLGGLFAADSSCRVTGMDLSETAVSRAAARFPGIEFLAGGIDTAAARFAQSADLVCCLEVIYYIPQSERAAVIAQLKSMLKPGGTLLISSMIAPPPYLTSAALQALVAEQLLIVSTGVLHLHPLVDIEKLWMKLMPGRRDRRPDEYLPGRAGFQRVERTARLFERLLGRRSDSHAFVIAGA